MDVRECLHGTNCVDSCIDVLLTSEHLLVINNDVAVLKTLWLMWDDIMTHTHMSLNATVVPQQSYTMVLRQWDPITVALCVWIYCNLTARYFGSVAVSVQDNLAMYVPAGNITLWRPGLHGSVAILQYGRYTAMKCYCLRFIFCFGGVIYDKNDQYVFSRHIMVVLTQAQNEMIHPTQLRRKPSKLMKRNKAGYAKWILFRQTQISQWPPSHAKLKENVDIGSIWKYVKYSNINTATICLLWLFPCDIATGKLAIAYLIIQTPHNLPTHMQLVSDFSSSGNGCTVMPTGSKRMTFIFQPRGSRRSGNPLKGLN